MVELGFSLDGGAQAWSLSDEEPDTLQVLVHLHIRTVLCFVCYKQAWPWLLF